MKLQRTVILGLFAAFFLIACDKEKEPELTESQKMRIEVMEVHDAVMPKMRDINQYLQGLEAVPADRKNQLIEEIMEDLREAEKGMWDWMQAFEDPPEDWEENRKVAYYRDQKILIQKVSDDMLESLESAGRVIKIPNE